MDKQWWVNIVAIRGGPGPSPSTSHVLPLPLPSRVSWSCCRGAASSLSACVSSSPCHLHTSRRCVVSALSCPCCIAGPCRCPCPGCVVVPHRRAVSEQGGLGRTEGGTYSGALTMTMNNESIIRRLVAMSLTATWHLHFVLEKKKGGGSELAHLGASLPVSVRRCWLSFVRGGVVRVRCVRSWAFFVICSCSGGRWGK